MNEPMVDIAQLQKRDPAEWTALLSGMDGLEEVVVSAVTARALKTASTRGKPSRRVSHYLLGLDGHSDPISLIGLHTTSAEALFYRDIAPHLPHLTPRCYLTHVDERGGWVVLADVADHYPRPRWTPDDVERILVDMAIFHVTNWEQDAHLRETHDWLPHFVDRENSVYNWEALRREHAAYFDEGPAALISDHAVQNAGRLAPRLLEAANGLTVMRSLGGWPGVLGESHLAAAADLLDDPVPMLEPLLRLPATLLHGDPNASHWRLSLFGERHLIDWRSAVIGPCILDLVHFQEPFSLLTSAEGDTIFADGAYPATNETIIDTYLLAMKSELGSRFDARTFRRALPAARCLYTLLTWFPYFATWYDKLPNPYVWQRYNRLDDAALRHTPMRDLVGLRPYLQGAFRRFIQSYRQL